MRLTSRVLKSSILIDEDNARMHLRQVGIDGMRSWKNFYTVVHNILKENFGRNMKAEYNFYGALPPKDLVEQYSARHRFIQKLKYDGIKVSLGECHRLPDGSITQKQVDLLICMDILEKAMFKYDYLVLFSSDADFVPVLERAKTHGAHTIAIISKDIPAHFTKKHINEVIYLEDIIEQIDKEACIFTRDKERSEKSETEIDRTEGR